jgi:3-oxoacyl-[acyl-carrier protein] reductase
VDLGLGGRVALVTGSSRGLGYATVRSLAREGCAVCLTARGVEGLDAAVSRLVAEGADLARVHAVPADLATEAGIDAAIDGAVSKFGRLDILVNNIGLGRGGGLIDTPDAEWQTAIDQTLYPAIRASRRAVPHMQKQNGGVIIMIASIWGRESGGRMVYNAVKAAEISLAKSLAQQLAADNIRVLSVAPGSILFEGGSWWKRQRDDPDGIAEFTRRELPFGRFGRDDEVGDVVAFLASSRASWISGVCLPIDGCQSRSNI